MAANLNYNVNINTSNGVQALNNLQNKINSVNKSFDGLKNAIGGIAIGSIISNVLKFADGIQDLSDVTGIATTNILGFQKAVEQFGGSADGADKAILKLVQNVGEAANGSAELQFAFSKVGISMNDLATMSEQDILRQTIIGLESITDKSVQAALKAQLLGKEFRGVATSGLAEAFAKSTAESEKYAASLRNAAELQDRLDRALSTIKLTLLEIISPAAEFVAALNPSRLAEAIEGFTKLAAVLVAFAAFGRLVTIAEGLAVAITGVGAAAAAMGLNLIKNFTVFGKVLTAAYAAVLGFKTLFPETAKSIQDSFGKALDSAKEFLGIESPKFLDQAEVDRENKLLKQRAEVIKESGQAAREVVDPFKALKETLSGAAKEYARINEQNIKGIELATSLIGLSSQEAEIRKANAELAKREEEAIKKLEDQKAKLTEAQKAAGIGKIIDEQISKIREQTKADMDATEAAIKNSEARKNAYALEQFARKSQIDVEKEIRDVQDQIATSTMGAMAKKEYEILAGVRERVIAEIKAEEVRRGSLMTDEEKQKYLDAALVKSRDLIGVHKKLYEDSRTFESGWNKAFREYVDDATNAAKRAENIFRKVTDGMEDLIVGFVKTGKFEWKSFVGSLAEDLLRSNLKSIIGGIFGSVGGGLGGLLGGAGGAASSKGQSANNPLYVIDIAGGGAGGGGGGFMGPQQPGAAGPLSGIWDSIKGIGSSIFDGVSSAVGGIADAVGGAFGGIADAVGGLFGGGGGGGGGSWLGDIASGIGDFFGGWFANGGNLGAGKWGIAGENGPELIQGPASISPMGGGGNVTYNINAVDAASFKAMIAADPSFIHGVAMMGAKGMPARR